MCGYSKGKDGKVTNEGSEDFLVPAHVSAPVSSSLSSTHLVTPETVNNKIKSVAKETTSYTLLSKRKDTAHDDYDEEDLDEVESDIDDNDDDENAEDSMAFSNYVRARMSESDKPSKVANFGSGKQCIASSTVPQKISVQGGHNARTQIAKTEKVLSTLFSVRHHYSYYLI